MALDSRDGEYLQGILEDRVRLPTNHRSVSAAMDHVAVWPYAIPMDSSGKMIDDYQGIYSRGLCRPLRKGCCEQGSVRLRRVCQLSRLAA